MKTIYKYEIHPLATSLPILVEMLKGAIIRHISMQGIHMYVWAEVDPAEPRKEDRLFEVYMTGDEIREDMGISRVYLHTLLLKGGNFVVHVYERLN